MRYFVCAMGGVQLGMPAGFTERIITASGAARGETESRISLADLFGRKDQDTPHGIVLKSAGIDGEKMILLAPKIEKDIEIEDRDIHGLPDCFSGVYNLMKGVCFNGPDLIFIMDPEKIAKLRLPREKAGTP